VIKDVHIKESQIFNIITRVDDGING